MPQTYGTNRLLCVSFDKEELFSKVKCIFNTLNPNPEFNQSQIHVDLVDKYLL
jgi:hypothetical protein